MLYYVKIESSPVADCFDCVVSQHWGPRGFILGPEEGIKVHYSNL